MLTRPEWLLRAEGGVILAVAAAVFGQTGVSWWWFGGLLLLPDLAMLGYLGGPRLGAACYNAAHTYAGPAALGALAVANGWWLGLGIALTWTAHVGLDRLLGYGLKRPTAFGDTHLGRIGRTAEPAA